ncbi:DIX domain-containing protein [Ditylenchus destructor]|nr:DIX domain-containing protein [Ditylenchus destructor]
MTMSTDGEITASDIDQEQLTTKVYYYMDDQPMPFATEIPVPPSKITLYDFKQFINKKKYKFYHKVMDPVLKTEVKTDILDEKEILIPNSRGLYELFLLSDNNAAIAGTSGRPIVNIRTLQNRASVRPIEHGAHIYPQRHRSHHENLRQANQYFDDSSSQEESNLFMDSNVRMHSDDESRYSTDITSVSQQPAHNKKYDSSNKPYWARDRRRRPKKSYQSFLSTTFDDTQVSMALDLITVTFHLDSHHPFGMSVIGKGVGDNAGIYVHEITPGGLVALDGRIKLNYLILDVNDISLDQYDCNAGIELLRKAVRVASEKHGHLKLTCARSDFNEPAGGVFKLPSEPVRPIDPLAWVQHCNNEMRGLNRVDNGVSLQPTRNTLNRPGATKNYIETVLTHTTSSQQFSQVVLPPPPTSTSTNNAAVASTAPGWPSSGVGSSIESSGDSLNCKVATTNTIKRGALTLIQNPATDMSADLCTTVMTLDDEKPKQKRCSGFGCAVKRMFCLHPQHRRRVATARKHEKTPKRSKKTPGKENCTHIP